MGIPKRRILESASLGGVRDQAESASEAGPVETITPELPKIGIPRNFEGKTRIVHQVRFVDTHSRPTTMEIRLYWQTSRIGGMKSLARSK
jgi:hypothetical protein